jgi:hypothetical protein
MHKGAEDESWRLQHFSVAPLAVLVLFLLALTTNHWLYFSWP